MIPSFELMIRYIKHCKFFLIASGIVFLISCSESEKPSHIVIQKGESKYLFSSMGANLVEASISKGEAPMVLKSSRIIPDGKEIYITFSELITIANLIGGNYELFEKKEPGGMFYPQLKGGPLVIRATNLE